MIDERVSAPAEETLAIDIDRNAVGNKVENTVAVVFVEAGTAKLVIEDETVMDGDRECVNDVGDVLLSHCLSGRRPIAPLNNYLLKSIATGNIFIISDKLQTAIEINKNTLWLLEVRDWIF
ncbi:jg6951 [Pararge aegeria aegeria]|uniref:Jg6951 protein n=1 Tax=Pararge aegeria aegeria TaxID=348720 RepID=A0A8S4S112_9NEOP|nr:jg6951 [Pararge aegeria aegeria]